MLSSLKDDIAAASRRIAPHIRRTPVLHLEKGAFGLAGRIVLKLEGQQFTGSFKPRGAFNSVLKQEQRPTAGLIAASGGNHGAAVAYVGRQLGLSSEIFVPTVSSGAKLRLLRDLGAKVTVAGNVYAESVLAAEARARETGSMLVRAFESRETIEGQGTLALELEEQAPHLDMIVCSVGGAGFIAGVAAWYGSIADIIGVEPEQAPSLKRALEAGAPVDVETGGIAADALGCRRVGELAFEVVKSVGVYSHLVTEDSIVRARNLLWSEVRLAVEPAAALPLALLLEGQVKLGASETAGLVVCGANTAWPY